MKLFNNNESEASVNMSRYSKMSDSKLIQMKKQNYYKPKLNSARQTKRNRSYQDKSTEKTKQ